MNPKSMTPLLPPVVALLTALLTMLSPILSPLAKGVIAVALLTVAAITIRKLYVAACKEAEAQAAKEAENKRSSLYFDGILLSGCAEPAPKLSTNSGVESLPRIPSRPTRPTSPPIRPSTVPRIVRK